MAKMTDQENMDRLQKDVEAVKNDISKLAQQIADALNSLAGTAQTEARRGYRRESKADVWDWSLQA